MMRYPPSTKLAFTVTQDDIINVQSEAVVTGEGPWLTSVSAVTKSLETVLPQLKRIRSQIRDNGGLDLWTAHVSPLVSSSRFQYVIHAVLDKGNNDQWLRFMKTLYKNIFKEADRNNISCIALPVLGTGKSASETAFSIEALVTSVLSYSPSYLTLVQVVTNDQDILDKVKARFKHDENRASESSRGIFGKVLTDFKDVFLPFSYYDENKDDNNSCRYEQTTTTAHGGHKSHSPAPHRDYKDHQSQLSRNRKQQETKRQSQEALQQHSEKDVVTIGLQDENISRGTLQQFEGQTSEEVAKCRLYTAALKKVAKERNLVMRDNKAKGDCMFVALSQQIALVLKKKVESMKLRREVVKYLRENPTTSDQTHLQEFITDKSWEQYLGRMQRGGEWGDNLIIQAAANVYQVEILLIMTTGEETTIEPYISHDPLPKIILGFDAERHYVSLETK